MLKQFVLRTVTDMTPAEQKLEVLKSELEDAAFPEYDTDAFWDKVEYSCDNATFVISEQAIFIDKLLKIINE